MDEQQQPARQDPAADGDLVIEPAHDDEPAPVRSLRRRLVVMGAAIVGSGLAAASVTMGPTALRMYAQKDATLANPAQAAGLLRDDSSHAESTAADLRNVVAARFTMESTLGAIYNDPSAPTRTVLLVGGTAFLSSPADELGHLFALLHDTAGGVTGIREVEPGSMGGVMKCGSADSTGGAMSVCGWADHGSLVLALFPGRDVDDSAKVLRDLRIAIQHRP